MLLLLHPMIVTLPGFSICAPVPVIRGLTRFLTMAEVAEVEDGVVIIDCVAIFYEEGDGGEHYRKKNNFRCRVSRISKKTPCKVKRENLVSVPLTGSLRSMEVLLSRAQERRSREIRPRISSRFLCPRPPLLLSAPNQNRHAT